MTKAALDAAKISWRHGSWEYAGLGHEDVWPGGAVECAQRCQNREECFHWVFDCKNLKCYYYTEGGYEEDGSSQFGRDYDFIGDSTHYHRWLAEIANEQKAKAPEL